MRLAVAYSTLNWCSAAVRRSRCHWSWSWLPSRRPARASTTIPAFPTTLLASKLTKMLSSDN